MAVNTYRVAYNDLEALLNGQTDDQVDIDDVKFIVAEPDHNGAYFVVVTETSGS